MIRATLIASALLVTSCAGGVAPAALLLGFGLLFLAATAWRSAQAGPPPRCVGGEATVCEGGVLRRRCGPGPAPAPFTPCGAGYCVLGRDVGRCPAPEPRVMPGACGGFRGQKACVKKRVIEACVMPVPTNYSGPSMNPHFQACGDDR